MGYKLKPNKSIKSRFKASRTGKLKHHHAKTSHLMSARSGKKKRHLGRPSILSEGLARNMRRLMGLSRLKPNQARHKRELMMAAKAEQK
jgi:large subunit ribosomal protein L35